MWCGANARSWAYLTKKINDNGSSGKPNTPPAEPPTPPETPTPNPTPDSFWTCPTDDSLYFCDDFEDGGFDDKWDDLISTYDLPSPGAGGNLNEGELILIKAAELAGLPNDYFVEYRIRPRNNGNTGNKYLYAMLRYQNPLEWYFGGLNMQRWYWGLKMILAATAHLGAPTALGIR